MALRSLANFRKEAAECIRLAEMATVPEVRKMLFQAAMHWQALAARVEASLQIGTPKPQPIRPLHVGRSA
jgi:hypothetical protein